MIVTSKIEFSSVYLRMTCNQLIVWLDANANDSISSFRTKLTENQPECVKIFTEIDPCVTFLQKHIHGRTFFIVSGSFGSTVVPLIYDCEHIYQIYLFCASIANHTSWAMDYTDKILMFEHENDLLRKLFKEIEEYLRQQAEQYDKQANIFKKRAQLFNQESCG